MKINLKVLSAAALLSAVSGASVLAMTGNSIPDQAEKDWCRDQVQSSSTLLWRRGCALNDYGGTFDRKSKSTENLGGGSSTSGTSGATDTSYNKWPNHRIHEPGNIGHVTSH